MMPGDGLIKKRDHISRGKPFHLHLQECCHLKAPLPSPGRLPPQNELPDARLFVLKPLLKQLILPRPPKWTIQGKTEFWQRNATKQRKSSTACGNEKVLADWRNQVNRRSEKLGQKFQSQKMWRFGWKKSLSQILKSERKAYILLR